MELKNREKNTIYTITEVVKLPVQGYKLGYKLEEIELNDSCFPYEFYDAERFMFLLDVSIELITHDLDDIEDDEDDDTPAIANFESLN